MDCHASALRDNSTVDCLIKSYRPVNSVPPGGYLNSWGPNERQSWATIGAYYPFLPVPVCEECPAEIFAPPSSMVCLGCGQFSPVSATPEVQKPVQLVVSWWSSQVTADWTGKRWVGRSEKGLKPRFSMDFVPAVVVHWDWRGMCWVAFSCENQTRKNNRGQLNHRSWKRDSHKSQIFRQDWEKTKFKIVSRWFVVVQSIDQVITGFKEVNLLVRFGTTSDQTRCVPSQS